MHSTSDDFRTAGQLLLDALCRHLEQAHNREIPVYPAADPQELVEGWPALTSGPQLELSDFIQQTLRRSNQLHIRAMSATRSRPR